MPVYAVCTVHITITVSDINTRGLVQWNYHHSPLAIFSCDSHPGKDKVQCISVQSCCTYIQYHTILQPCTCRILPHSMPLLLLAEWSREVLVPHPSWPSHREMVHYRLQNGTMACSQRCPPWSAAFCMCYVRAAHVGGIGVASIVISSRRRASCWARSKKSWHCCMWLYSHAAERPNRPSVVVMTPADTSLGAEAGTPGKTRPTLGFAKAGTGSHLVTA